MWELCKDDNDSQDERERGYIRVYVGKRTVLP